MKPSTPPYGEFYQRDRTLHPPALTPAYTTSVLRSPQKALISLPNSLSEITGPVFAHDELGPLDNDLIMNYAKDGLPIGERIVVHGHVLDENGRPVRNALVEIWQANAAGRYRHKKRQLQRADRSELRRVRTHADRRRRPLSSIGRSSRAPYPWRNHDNAWRPRTSTSRCSAPAGRSGSSRRCTSPATR